jgi:hypothetical protein
MVGFENLHQSDFVSLRQYSVRRRDDPLIKAMAPVLGGDAAILPLWGALSLGA